MERKTMPEPKIAIEESEDLAFLGREFMTWLLWRVDRGEATFTDDEGELTVAFAGRARLGGVAGDVTDAVLKGRAPAHGVEARAAIGAGRTLREAELRVTRGDREYRFTLVAETLDLKAVKLPSRLRRPDADRNHGPEDERLAERMLLLEQLEKSIKTMYMDFVRERSRPVWGRSVVPALRAWVVEGLAVDAR
jgi:hypothetical protein